MGRRVAVIGLDCAEPSLVFEQWRDELPNFRALMNRGVWGKLRSVDPPITVPAWSCMMSSHDPGQLGIYGFRNRTDHTYENHFVADSRAITVARLWDILGCAEKNVIVLGVPGTWPPPQVNGDLVSCFLTPDSRTDQFTFPPELREEVERLVGPYHVDVKNYRRDDRDRILAEIYEMTEQHFTTARHLLDSRPWDFFMMVEIGVDRIHHAFWSFQDPAHPKYEPGHRYRDVIRNYYQYLDDQLGEMLERFDEDDVVLIVSDHGAEAMRGAICVNDWLIQEGYLTLRKQPDDIAPLDLTNVDWSRTRVWGDGGYYGRIWMNIRGREPEGIVDPADADALAREIIERLEALPAPDGTPIGTRVYRPSDLWPERRGVAPDLIAYFGDLAWRSIGSIGHDAYYTFENDTGPDDANHSRDGMFIMTGTNLPPGERNGLKLLDVTPTILDLFNLPTTDTMRGRSITSLG
ncbi:MAG: alkaline phosphatase family protein [Thermomicrobiales bacterium]|nr:alkaline phosphatase family protein [Thermomicrobiales bacterium]